MAVGAIGEIQKVEQEKVDMYDAFTEAANEVELSSGALGDVLYNDTVDFAQEAKNNYLAALKAGDQKGMMAAKKAMQQRSQFTQQHKAFITDLAKLQKDGDLSAAQTPEENAYMTAVLKGNYKVEKNEKGEMVFNVNGVKKTNAEFEDMHILKNYTMGKTIGELNGKNKQSSAFDRNSVLNTISQSLPKNEKEFRAALVDDLGGGEGFKDLLIKDESLEPEIKETLMAIGGYDPDGDGTISQEEKDNFIAAITDHTNPNFNMEVSKRIMAEKMTQAVENNHTAHWKGVAVAKQQEEANKYLFEQFKNNLKIDLDGAQSTNDMIVANNKHLNDVKLVDKKESNLISRDDKIKGESQKAVMDYWNNNVIPKSEKEKLEFNKQGPTDKAQHFSREFQTATGDNTVNIKYSGKPFTDSSGRQVSSGYYIPQLEDVVGDDGIATGEKKQVFQLISEGDNIEATDILSFIKKGSSIASFASNSDDLNNAGNKR
jgi:hypothetical protein